MPYPSTVGTFTNPNPTDKLNSPSHSSIETTQNTAITEIQTFVGTLSSAVGTLVYDIRSSNSNGGGHVQAVNKGGTGFTSYTKGDLLVATSGSLLSKLNIGTDNQVLTVDSTQSAGVKWGNSTVPKMTVTTNFEFVGTRWSQTGGGDGSGVSSVTAATNGIRVSAGSVAGANYGLSLKGGRTDLLTGNSSFNVTAKILDTENPPSYDIVMAAGDVTVGSVAHIYTKDHYGFELTRSSVGGTALVKFTNGTSISSTQTVSSYAGLTTTSRNTFYAEKTGTSNIRYYINGSLMAVASDNIPNSNDANGNFMVFGVNNGTVASLASLDVINATFNKDAY